MSLIANLPKGGNSVYFSTTAGLLGFTFTIATSPVFMNSGFFCSVWPVFGSFFSGIRVIVIDHPTAIAPGYSPVFHIHTMQMAATITEILEKKDPKTGQTLQKNPEFIKTGDVAIVKVKPSKPAVVEKYSEFPPLGRFAIRDMGQTVAAGVVLDVVKKAA